MTLSRDAAGTLSLSRVVHPPKERRQHDVVVRQERIGEGGQRLIASAIDRPTALDQLAAAGALGEAEAKRRLLDASDWFKERLELLQLRAVVTAAFERQAKGERGMTPRQVRADAEMKRLAKAIGAEPFNRLFDLLVWDVLPLVEPRRRETVEALDAAARHLKL